MTVAVVTVTDRPDLAPLVARWRVEAFFDHPGGYTVADMTGHILAPPLGPKETFVLFDGGQPVATAGLVRTDLEGREDLTPWLAGVYVEPGFRRRGHASRLVRQVEDFALNESVGVIWLYTSSAESLYTRLGWERVEIVEDQGKPAVLMRRRLSNGA